MLKTASPNISSNKSAFQFQDQKATDTNPLDFLSEEIQAHVREYGNNPFQSLGIEATDDLLKIIRGATNRVTETYNQKLWPAYREALSAQKILFNKELYSECFKTWYVFKIQPVGLQEIQKVIGTSFDNKKELFNVNLVFFDRKHAEDFRVSIYAIFKKNEFTPFRLLWDSYNTNKFGDAHGVLSFGAFAGDVYANMLQSPEKTTDFILDELAKYVDLSGIKQIFWDSSKCICISEEEALSLISAPVSPNFKH
jgi:hypothetical protein